MTATSRAQSPAGASPAALPSTFIGVLPCADCPGIRYHLNLFADGVFHLRMAYQDRGVASDDVGRWVISSDRKILMLKGGRGASVTFAWSAGDTLRLLDAQGEPIPSSLNYELKRSPTIETFEPQVSMAGMYRYVADAGSFVECITGRRMGVAQEGANATLEAAYGKAKRVDGASGTGPANEEVKVFVDGRLAVRRNSDTGVEQTTLVVDRFVRAAPGETCAPLFAAWPIETTAWRATQLAGMPAGRGIERDAQLTLDGAGRVAGSDGCNRVIGSYTLTGDAIAFGPLAGTRMACAGTADLERAFRDALRDSTQWRITGDLLDLFDVSGKRLARFQARAAN
jgi:copper homeostasis protein (lipoprotein)